MIKKVSVLLKKENPKAVAFSKKLIPFLDKKGCKVNLSEKNFLKDDLLLTLGGDGTFIKGVRCLHGAKVPVMGVRLGEFGFLAEIIPEHFEKQLEAILAGKLKVQEQIKIKATVYRKNKVVATYHCLNDAVLHSSGVARISRYQVSINKHLMCTMKADGVLVATPTGSSAYSYAAGGPIVEPKNSVLVLTPICPQLPKYRPLILADTSFIEIELIHINGEVMLTLDGQEESKIEEGDRIQFEKSEIKAYFARIIPDNYFETLRNKFF